MNVETLIQTGLAQLGQAGRVPENAAALLARYGELLVEKNRVMNLTAITQPRDVATLHMLDCAALLNCAGFEGKTLIDVGTGAGFPGVPLAALVPSLTVTLLDALNKRVDWLGDTCKALVLDNAHAVHPNHPEYHDATHRPAMNAGLVIKHGVRYATDGAAQAVFTALCRRAGVPVQHFSNRSDLAGGSTLGNISNAHVSVNTVDIGLAQLAMHSCFETAGVRDAGYLVQAMTAFYAASYREEAGRMILD